MTVEPRPIENPATDYRLGRPEATARPGALDMASGLRFHGVVLLTGFSLDRRMPFGFSSPEPLHCSMDRRAAGSEPSHTLSSRTHSREVIA